MGTCGSTWPTRRRRASKPPRGAGSRPAGKKKWCPGPDSNWHGLLHTPLKRARLPIPPPGHGAAREGDSNRKLFRGRSRGRRECRGRPARRGRNADRRGGRCREGGFRGRGRLRPGENRGPRPGLDQRDHDREDRERPERPRRDLLERRRGAESAEGRLGGRGAESGRHVSALALLEKDDEDQEDADDDVNGDEDVDHYADAPDPRAVPGAVSYTHLTLPTKRIV